MGWLSGWYKRVKVTIDSGDVDAALTDFPVLVYLSASSGLGPGDVSFIFDELGSDANRKKIAVTTDDGTTECYVEIDKWDDANEQAWLWVKAPAISATVDTVLYLYYNGAHADNDAHVGDTGDAAAESVWEASAVMVQHMKDATTSTILDSTGYDNDGAKVAANEPIETASGKIDSAQSFDGINDKVDLTAPASLQPTTELTVSIWINCTVWGHPLRNGYISTAKGVILYHSGVSRINFRIGNGVVFGNTVSDAAPTAGVWEHYVGTYDGTTVRLYKNAILQITTATLAPPIVYSSTAFTLGGIATAYMTGRMDEVRVYNVAQSAAWIKADYESTRDHLLTFGIQSIMTAARAILADLQTQWSLVDPLDAGNIHFHADWYDGKQIKPQITITGPISSPVRYFGPPAETAGLHLLSWMKYLVNVWVRIPAGEDSTRHSEYAEQMRKEVVRILNKRRESYGLPIGLVIPIDQGRAFHELDSTPRILRYEITVQANRKHT